MRGGFYAQHAIIPFRSDDDYDAGWLMGYDIDDATGLRIAH